jgi:hypothetical protein
MPDNPSVSCCNDADCYPTEMKYVDGSIYAKRREDGKYIAVPAEKVERNRDNPDGRNHLCAPHRAPTTHPIPCSASHWEAPHEVRMVNARTPCVLCCEPIEANYLPGMEAELGVMLAPPIAALLYPFHSQQKTSPF